MDSNKIADIVRIQQIFKKWKKAATTSRSNIKRNRSFTDHIDCTSSRDHNVVPKGFIAVCVGQEVKRYEIPAEYLGHEAFGMLLQQAEEEFGFEQEGVLRIPCSVSVFDNILKIVQHEKQIMASGDRKIIDRLWLT
ncbi:auxin-responsive protein SAUR71-like [Mercurialis annua]|uniref:auxin-responsive protein SAUR71-like n=1 Tax=Mercurialis annua TaxID=3986 RepID=UPI00215F33C6|nr:auxin-responsive protein SAUR71-like [Mercurialis annua]